MSLFLRGRSRPRDVLARGLGDLERRVLELMWSHDAPLTTREVQARLGEGLAYTTLMTTLDRLHKKGILERAPAGRAYAYRPRLTRAEMEHTVSSDVIEGLLATRADVSPLLATFVDAVSERDRMLLSELERLVREKRARRRRREDGS